MFYIMYTFFSRKQIVLLFKTIIHFIIFTKIEFKSNCKEPNKITAKILGRRYQGVNQSIRRTKGPNYLDKQQFKRPN